ncbi:MAG: FemAB family PEP-CTERM system-associated protein [Proteobacteria bacterium]|nr:FemAB family PEP-CTERM system-associated protein [Pseudomonadota bacterium]
MNVVAPPLVVDRLEASSTARWDAFVDSCPTATFFHRAGWKTVIEESFGHRAYYLHAAANGRIRGVLPLVHVKSRLFGNALTSIPFGVYGGPAAADDAARGALDSAAADLAESLDVDHLEYRSLARTRPDWKCKADVYATFRKAIDADPEKNLLGIPRKQRAVVRQSLKAGLEARAEDGTDRLYDIYAESVRNLGTPVFSRGYFRNLKRVFGESCEALVIYKDGTPVSGVLSFFFRDEVLPYYGGGRPEARGLGGADFMYWDLMRRAGQRGCKIYDFGRSKFGTGAFAFKKNWGFTPQPLAYEYLLRRGDAVPDVNPLNPKYRMFIALWKRLPLAIANRIGPHIVRNLG